MKNTIYLFSSGKGFAVLLSIILMSFTNSISDDWIRYENKMANCSINFPNEPKVKEKKRDKTVSLKIKCKDDNYRYSLNCTVAKADYRNTDDLTEKLYKIFTDAIPGKVEEKSTFEIGSNNGITAKILSDEGAGTVYRIIIIKNVLYQFFVVSGSDYMPKELQDKFFNSFELLNI